MPSPASACLTSIARTSVRLAGFMSLLLIIAATHPASSPASSSADERSGARILRNVEGGTRWCSNLRQDEFREIGEYVMGRMVGSRERYKYMNQFMRNSMGKRMDGRMRRLVGRTFVGCQSKDGGMMGTDAGDSMMGSGSESMMGTDAGGSMMGGGIAGGSAESGGPSAESSYGPSSMMRNSAWARAAGDGLTILKVVAGALTLLCLLAVIVVGTVLLTQWRDRTRAKKPIATLQTRLAKGDIDLGEYDRTLQALRAVP